MDQNVPGVGKAEAIDCCSGWSGVCDQCTRLEDGIQGHFQPGAESQWQFLRTLLLILGGEEQSQYRAEAHWNIWSHIYLFLCISAVCILICSKQFFKRRKAEVLVQFLCLRVWCCCCRLSLSFSPWSCVCVKGWSSAMWNSLSDPLLPPSGYSATEPWLLPECSSVYDSLVR